MKSYSFPFPLISVGNLSTGGTGKTPHVEYIIQLLRGKYRLASLSRGYKRNTSGFLLADENSTSLKIGDEPYQLKSKFSDVVVAVDEKRVRGVRNLLETIKGLNVIILDDAFQHRKIVPGLSILLTDFRKLYSHDYVLPRGRLREYRTGANRADIIVVTKSPKILSPLTKERVIESIKPRNHQSVYFSFIKYGQFSQIPGVSFNPRNSEPFDSILLVAGIANPTPLEVHLSECCTQLEKLYFPDHHKFSEPDIQRIINELHTIEKKSKVIVTTEKDMTRFIQPEILDRIKDLPICYIPIEINFHGEDKELFENQIESYVRGR